MELNDPLFNTENSNQAHESLNTLLGRTHFKENINSCALLLLSGLQMYQSWNICIESHTMSIICKLRMPTCDLENMLGILCRSWIQFNNIFKRRYYQHNIEAGVLSHSITLIQGCPNRFGIAELQIAFIKFSRMRKCECTYAKTLLFIPKIYEN